MCVYGKSKGKDFRSGRVRGYEWMKFGGLEVEFSGGGRG